MNSKTYYIYILTNKTNSVLYTGVTNNLVRRIYEHKQHLVKGFTGKYNVNKLVYYECFSDIKLAIEREKQIKGGSRVDKINMIKGFNSGFEDLYSLIV